jgi:hypothetical protein
LLERKIYHIYLYDFDSLPGSAARSADALYIVTGKRTGIYIGDETIYESEITD